MDLLLEKKNELGIMSKGINFDIRPSSFYFIFFQEVNCSFNNGKIN